MRASTWPANDVRYRSANPKSFRRTPHLGTGGDNSNGASGEFFEGSVTPGYPSDATENAVQAGLTTAGYAQTSAPSGPITSGLNSAKCVDDSAFSTANGNKIQMWDCTGGVNQQWTVEPDGTLQVYGKCMDITGANYGNGTLIELWRSEEHTSE